LLDGPGLEHVGETWRNVADHVSARLPCAAAAALKDVSMTAATPARSLPALSRL
jgi:hypothetical protein